MFAIHVLKVPVADVSRAEPFWTALLGHRPVTVTTDRAQYDVDGLDILLYRPQAGDGQAGSSLHFQLSHDDLEKVMERLPLDTVAAIHEEGETGRTLEARDPDGNLIRIVLRLPER